MTKADSTNKREHFMKFLSKKCSLNSKCYIVFYPINYSSCVIILHNNMKNCCQFVVNSDLMCRKPLILLGFLVEWLHRRKKNYFSYCIRICKKHYCSINTDTHTTCWRHTIFHSSEEILIKHLCLIIAAVAKL